MWIVPNTGPPTANETANQIFFGERNTTPPPPRTGIPYFPYSPEQWPVQWVLRTIAQKWAILGTHLSLFPALPHALDQTMPCNVCHSKNAETVAFLSLAESDRCTLRQKHSDCAEDWVICELCVRQARPNLFFLGQCPAGPLLQPVLLLLLLPLLILQQVQPLLLPRVLYQ